MPVKFLALTRGNILVWHHLDDLVAYNVLNAEQLKIGLGTSKILIEKLEISEIDYSSRFFLVWNSTLEDNASRVKITCTNLGMIRNHKYLILFAILFYPLGSLSEFGGSNPHQALELL